MYKVNHKMVICGGHDTWLKKIKRELSGNVKYIDRERVCDMSMIRNADVVWIQINAIAHKQYYAVMNEARKYNKPVGILKNTSADKCIKQIIGGCLHDN